ncbi:hypothetical protein FRB99_006693 [Tulasnella sp. 403]|nr:hypothetical protein FRB99_006693 [Tulasnella sp. 403]
MPQGANPVLSLPVELWIQIFGYLRIVEVLRVRQTCKRLQEVTHSHPLWVDIAKTHITDQGLGLPRLPHPDLKSVDSACLEASVKKALAICKNITSKPPGERSVVSRLVDSAYRNQPVVNVHILPREHGRQYVICSLGGGFANNIYFWKLDDEPLAISPRFTWQTPGYPSSIVVDKSQEREATIAYRPKDSESTPPTTYILHFRPNGQSLAEIKKVPDTPPLLKKMKGPLLFFYNEAAERCEIVNWKIDNRSHYRLPPTTRAPNMSCLALEIIGNAVIAVVADHIFAWEWKEDGHVDSPFPFYAGRIESRTNAANIIPYNPKWKLSTRGTSLQHAASIVLRKSVTNNHSFHYIFRWDDTCTNTTFENVQACVTIRRNMQHVPMFFAPSGRGVVTGVYVTAPRPPEGTPDPVLGVDILKRYPKVDVFFPKAGTLLETHPISNLNGAEKVTSMDYDDVEGRVAVGTQSGKIFIVDL